MPKRVTLPNSKLLYTAKSQKPTLGDWPEKQSPSKHSRALETLKLHQPVQIEQFITRNTRLGSSVSSAFSCA